MGALGSRIKVLRLKTNLSKAALARRVGVSDVTISYWESGTIKQIGHERLVALTEALDCTLSELLDGTPASHTANNVMHLHLRRPAPWLMEAHAPAAHLAGLPGSQWTEGCYLVTPAPGEQFDFLIEGELAAVHPLAAFEDNGLYILESDDGLRVRHLSRNIHGELCIRDEHRELASAPTNSPHLRLLAHVRMRWRPVVDN